MGDSCSSQSQLSEGLGAIRRALLYIDDLAPRFTCVEASCPAMNIVNTIHCNRGTAQRVSSRRQEERPEYNVLYKHPR